MLENIGNAVSCQAIDQFGRNLGCRITSCPRHVGHDAVPWQRSLPSNSALNISSYGRRGWKREPILMKFAAQQQIW